MVRTHVRKNAQIPAIFGGVSGVLNSEQDSGMPNFGAALLDGFGREIPSHTGDCLMPRRAIATGFQLFGSMGVMRASLLRYRRLPCRG